MNDPDLYTTPEQERAKMIDYENELVSRYLSNLPLSKWDKKDARKIIREREKGN